MDFGYVDLAAFYDLLGYAVVTVNDFNVTVAEVGIVAVNKAVVAAGNSVVFDAVAGKNIHLHAVICHKKMVAPFHDFMVGVVKQVIYIKFIAAGLAIIIGKGGTKLKQIGSEAREDIEKLISMKVYLDIWVKVRNDWRNNEAELRKLNFLQD